METPLAPLQRAQGDDFHEKQSFTLFSMELADQIYEYYHREPTLRMCRDLRYSHVFRGGLEIVQRAERRFKRDFGTEAEFMAFIRRALDFRDMFGFCPVKRYRSLQTGEYRFSIPEFGTGKYVAQLDKKTWRAVPYFLPEAKKDKKKKGRERTSPVKGYDPEFQIFVWPGKEPVWRSKTNLTNQTVVQFGSKIFPLFKKFAEVRRFWENQLDGDTEVTHPTQYSTHKADYSKVLDMSEEEVYGDVQEGGPIDGTPRGRETYQRNVVRAVMLEMSLDQKRRENAGEGEGQAQQTDQSGKLVPAKPLRKELEKVVPLPIGDDLGRPVLPDAKRNVTEIEEAYNELLCLVMGIPRNFFRSKGKFQANVEEDIQVLRTTIMQDREDANAFFQYVYELGYRENENRYLSEVLSRATRFKRQAKEKDDQERATVLSQQRREAKNLLRTPFRAELRFLEDPFVRQVDVKMVQLAAISHAITAEEEINFYRTRLDLDKVESGNKLVTELERKRKREVEMEKQKIAAVRETKRVAKTDTTKPTPNGIEKKDDPKNGI